jgi:hypothetical protein
VLLLHHVYHAQLACLHAPLHMFGDEVSCTVHVFEAAHEGAGGVDASVHGAQLACEAHVRHLGAARGIQQDVAALYVPAQEYLYGLTWGEAHARSEQSLLDDPHN